MRRSRQGVKPYYGILKIEDGPQSLRKIEFKKRVTTEKPEGLKLPQVPALMLPEILI